MYVFDLGAIIARLEIYVAIVYDASGLNEAELCILEMRLVFGVYELTIKQTITRVLVGFCLILLFMYAYYIILVTFRYELFSRLNLQTQLFEEAAKTNEELRLSQNKFKKIHEKVAKQKSELELANKILNKMTAEIYTQNELLRYISSVLDIKELIDMVTDAIMGTIGVDTCSLVLFDEMHEEYLFSVKSTIPGDHKSKLIEDVNKGYLQKYFESGKIHLNNRVLINNYPFISERPVGSIAIIPLLRDKVAYGMIIAEHNNLDMFTENNVQFFSGIATQITIAVNNAGIYALMEEMAIKDGLTGIYNRKYLQDHIDDIINTAQQEETSVTAVLFDIDKFKSVNDRYGHQFGDEAIKAVAVEAQKIAKKQGGLAIRYGGEEFVLIMPDKAIRQAEPIVRELHRNIKDKVLLHNDEEVHINVSIGVSTYPEIAISGENLLLRTDNAMYYSKEHGRGRITLDHKNLDKVI